MIKKHIPNSITCCNLISGCIATYFAFRHDFEWALAWMVIGAVFDFFDGMTARLLHVSSPIGKELDSLADDITFGLAPSAMLFAELGVVAYPSALEPWDRCLTGQEGRAPGYDPLRFAIEECHKRGMELHAWLATIPCGPWTSLGCRRLRAKGLRLRKLDGAGYLDPSDERVAPYLASVCAELTEKYDIDGIHLDYIRYPDGWPRATRRNGDTPDNRRAQTPRDYFATLDFLPFLKPLFED